MRAKPGYISLDGLAGAVHHGHTAAGDERAPRDGLHLAGKIFRENISETKNILPEESILAPASAPAVLDQPEVLPSLRAGTVANHQDCVVQPLKEERFN